MRSLHIRMPLDFAIDGFSGKRDIHVTGPVQRLDDLGQRRFRDAGGYELAGVNLGSEEELVLGRFFGGMIAKKGGRQKMRSNGVRWVAHKAPMTNDK